MSENQVRVGQSVTFVNPKAQHITALVTAVHGPQCVNLVHVNTDESQRDSHGQKLLRESSVVHKDLQPAHGNYWF